MCLRVSLCDCCEGAFCNATACSSCGSGRGPIMSVVDSEEAVFAARCSKVGLSDAAATALRSKGWGTYANFAFSTAVIPGQGDDSIFVRDVIVAILGREDHASAAALRRLHFESYTLTAAELKRQTEATESDVPRNRQGSFPRLRLRVGLMRFRSSRCGSRIASSPRMPW